MQERLQQDVYKRQEDMSSDLKLSRCSLDRIIRDQIHKYAGIFVSKKLTLTYESISQDVLTDEKWLGFVIGQILSNALKYTRTGGIRIYLEKKLSLDTDAVSYTHLDVYKRQHYKSRESGNH